MSATFSRGRADAGRGTLLGCPVAAHLWPVDVDSSSLHARRGGGLTRALQPKMLVENAMAAYRSDLERFSVELEGKIDPNEIKLHNIFLIDHTYDNRFGYDLNKSRSFCLGYDSMLIAYAISNQIRGEIRGLLGIYTIRSNEVEVNSYININ